MTQQRLGRRRGVFGVKRGGEGLLGWFGVWGRGSRRREGIQGGRKQIHTEIWTKTKHKNWWNKILNRAHRLEPAAVQTYHIMLFLHPKHAFKGELDQWLAVWRIICGNYYFCVQEIQPSFFPRHGRGQKRRIEGRLEGYVNSRLAGSTGKNQRRF